MIKLTERLEGGALMRRIAVLGLALLAAGSLPAATVAIGQLQLTNANGYQLLTFYNKTGVGNGGCDGVEYEVCNGVTIQSWTLTITYANSGNSTPNVVPGASPLKFTSTASDAIAPYSGSGAGYTGSPSTGTWEIPLTGIGGTEPACPPCDYQITQVQFSGTFNSANIPFVIGSPGNQSEFGANPTFSTTWTAPASLYGASLNSAFFGAQFDVTATDQQTTPLIFITKTHSSTFTQNQTGATYSVTVSNQAGAVATTGAVTVTEAVPTGLTLTSMSGTGWTCPNAGTTCTRSDALAGGSSYPPITVTVNVASNAPASVVNSVTVSGGSSASATATDTNTVGVAVTPLGSITATAATSGPGSAYPIPTGVCSYTTNCYLVNPGVFNIPVSISLNNGITLNSLTFGVQITPTGAAPAFTSGSLTFTPAASITNVPVVSAGNTANAVSVLWSSLSSALSGSNIALGTVTGTLPASAAVGQSYTVTVTGVSGANGSITVPLTVGAAGAITVAPIYLVGDVAPYTSNAAPNFGDGVLNILDLIQELFAVNNVSGFVPAACSDRLDAMDLFPADTATSRGGDGVLDIRDLILELFRVNNLDLQRPVRRSPAGSCASGSSVSSIAPSELTRTTVAPRPLAATQGAVVLGAPVRSGQTLRVPVYLSATANLDGVAVTFAAGDGHSQLRFVASPQTPPSLANDSQLGVVAAIWANGVTVKAGSRLLLGYVEAPSGAAPSLTVYGASGSGVSDNREVRLTAGGLSAQ
jgi:hypothetical protein